MRTLLTGLLTICLLFPSTPLWALEEIYLAIERGTVLFRVDRNRWESAPNYLKLRQGDRLRAMPGTVGKIYHSCGAEFHMPTGGTVTIEDRGLSQVMGDDKVIIRWKDGLYESEVVPADSRDPFEADEPRMVETWPSVQFKEQRQSRTDEIDNKLRARLTAASRTVLDEDLSRTRDRLSPFDRTLPGVRPAPRPVEAFDLAYRREAGEFERRRVATDKLRLRRMLEAELLDADALARAVYQVKLAGNSALAEETALRVIHDRIRDFRFRLSQLQEREFLLQTR